MQDAIYLNHAGTSWPKPLPVRRAIEAGLAQCPSQWGESFESAHQAICDHFGVTDPQRMLLTPGGTSAIAVALADFPVEAGEQVLTSHLEHHSVQRCLEKLSHRGIKVSAIACTESSAIDIEEMRRQLATGKVKLIALTAACNVTGDILDCDAVIRLGQEFDVPVMIDASQTVGWREYDFPNWGADLVAFAGHKGLQAPWGLGGLYISDRARLRSPAAVCEPTDTPHSSNTCNLLPGYCDVGSVDRLALEGLAAAIDWLAAPEQAERLHRARMQIATFEKTLKDFDEVELLGFTTCSQRLPTLAFRVRDRSVSELAKEFSGHGLVVAAGYQCAPRAHQALGTADTGVIRVSVGPQTTDPECLRANEVLQQVITRNTTIPRTHSSD